MLWRTTHLLTSPLEGQSPPAPVAAGTPGFGWPAIGLRGGALRPVRLPIVPAGSYRIVKDVRIGPRATHVAAYIAIRAA